MVGRLVQQLHETEVASPGRQALHDALCERGAQNIFVRETFIFRALARKRWKGVVSSTLSVHLDFKRVLADVMVLDPRDEAYLPQVAVLGRRASLQMLEDDAALVPALRLALDLDERRALWNDVENALRLGSAEWDDASATRAGAQDLIEEARIVLSGFAPPRARGAGARAPA